MSVTVELRTVRLPLVRPFRTSRGTEAEREVLLIGWQPGDVQGWGECGADPAPVYFPEFLPSVRLALTGVLIPLAVRAQREADAAGDGSVVARLRAAFAGVPGMPLAKAALETAVLDAWLRERGMPLAAYLGGHRSRVPVGVSVGIPDSAGTLLSWVGEYLAAGYRRVKLKIEPGWDIEPVAAVRAEFGDDLPLQVDANQAYGAADLGRLLRLDEYGLLLVEQPFGADQLTLHARLAAAMDTPVCLDESIVTVGDAVSAITLGAAGAINIKPARVGGYLSARIIHDLCLAHGVPVFCGGLLELGIGRAGNLALATLPGFTLPGDISATSRYFTRDITEPFELDDGYLVPPSGPGTGVVPAPEALGEFTTAVERFDAG